MRRHVFLLVFSLLCTGQVFAVGFEQAKLHSHLDEPLDVRVGLLLDESEDLTQSRVELASPREYNDLEQLLPQSYYDIRVDIQGLDTAKPAAHITSQIAISESILVLVLKVKRGRGNYFKKIQIFLDAAVNKPLKKKAAWKKSPDSVARYTSPVISPSQDLRSLDLATGALQTKSGGWSRRDSYGPVQYGDSLSEIAYRLRKDKRWSNQQIMLALYQSNPDAFVNQNMNQLKKGSFLAVPDDAEVRAFVNSPEYQSLRGSQTRVKAKPVSKISKAEKAKPEAKENPRFQGRISLGLAEPVDVPVVDVMMLKRLEKLEPLYEKVMGSDLRMDDIGGKVDLLAKEVIQLHKKIDALAEAGQTKDDGGIAYGWLGFLLLLIINILLAVAYFYRKQMRTWQTRLNDLQHQNVHKHTDKNDSEDALSTVVMGDPFSDYSDKSKANEDDAVEADNTQDNNKDGVPEVNFAPAPAPELEEQAPKNERPLAQVPSEEKERILIDYALSFEEMVHKREWDKAEKYYEQLSEEECNRPRIQALLIEKLHGQGDILGRNITLLTLFNLYEDKQWHHFCTFFDDGIWHTLQNENVINYTGKVNQAEVERVSKEAMKTPEALEDMLDLSDEDIDNELSEKLVLGNSKLELDQENLPQSEVENLLSEFSDEESLSQEPALGSSEFNKTLKIDETLPVNAEEIEAQIRAKSLEDEGLDFEFDFSVLEPESSIKGNVLNEVEPRPEPDVTSDAVDIEEGFLSLDLEDSDFTGKDKP